ncbi:hypothetical protein T08_3170 [Trichinella sp. T8]|nr:hypothetical protein T08_3170 [Trichinella sp. T8]
MAVHIMCLSIQGTTKKRFAKIYISQYFSTLSDFRKLKLLNSTAFILILKFSCASKLRVYDYKMTVFASSRSIPVFKKSCLWGFSALLLAFSKDIFKLEYLHV